MKYLLFIVFLFPLALFAQEKIINGKITNDDGNKEGIHILNISSLVGTITKKDGTFQINGQINDTLIISSIQYKTEKIVLGTEHIATTTLIVALIPKINQLDEVTVRPHNLSGNLTKDLKNIKTIYDSIRPTKLGLPNAYVKIKPKSERLLASSGSVANPIFLLINTLNGNRKRLKKIVQLERDIIKRKKIKEQFESTIYYDYLRIPEGKIDDFIIFCSLDTKFEKITTAKDKLLLLDFLEAKSKEYKTLNNIIEKNK